MFVEESGTSSIANNCDAATGQRHQSSCQKGKASTAIVQSGWKFMYFHLRSRRLPWPAYGSIEMLGLNGNM